MYLIISKTLIHVFKRRFPACFTGRSVEIVLNLGIVLAKQKYRNNLAQSCQLRFPFKKYPYENRSGYAFLHQLNTPRVADEICSDGFYSAAHTWKH